MAFLSVVSELADRHERGRLAQARALLRGGFPLAAEAVLEPTPGAVTASRRRLREAEGLVRRAREIVADVGRPVIERDRAAAVGLRAMQIAASIRARLLEGRGRFLCAAERLRARLAPPRFRRPVAPRACRRSLRAGRGRSRRGPPSPSRQRKAQAGPRPPFAAWGRA